MEVEETTNLESQKVKPEQEKDTVGMQTITHRRSIELVSSPFASSRSEWFAIFRLQLFFISFRLNVYIFLNQL
jgi:hypothetical protein